MHEQITEEKEKNERKEGNKRERRKGGIGYTKRGYTKKIKEGKEK